MTSRTDGTFSAKVAGYYYYVHLAPHALPLYLTPPETTLYPSAPGQTLTAPTFTYRSPAIITGLLTDDAGTPLAGFGIALDPSYNGTAAQQTTTDSNGRYTFSFDQANATQHSIEAYAHAGYTKRSASNPLGGAFATDSTVKNGLTWNVPTLVLDRNGTVSGTLTGGDGTALAGVTVYVDQTDSWAHCTSFVCQPGYEYYCYYYGYCNTSGSFHYEATTDALGRYSISAPVGTGAVVHPRKAPHYTTPANSPPLTLGVNGSATANFVYPQMVTVVGTLSTNTGTLPDCTSRTTRTTPTTTRTAPPPTTGIRATCSSSGSSTYTLELPAGAGDGWYLRLTKTGNVYTGEYSRDHVTWQQFDGVANGAMPVPKIGVYAFGTDGQVTPITASFDYFRLDGASSPCATTSPASDEFSGSALDTCRWDSLVRVDPAYVSVSGGSLRITTQTGDIWGAGNNGQSSSSRRRRRATGSPRPTSTHRCSSATSTRA